MAQTRSAASWRGQALDAVLFDLDGTLLNTVADIARALNRTLDERGWAPLPVSDVSRMIGRGSQILIERAAAARGYVLNDVDRTTMLDRFFHHYGALEERNESDAQPYAGVSETLRTLHDARMKIAVVTNKQWRFADGLLHRLDLKRWVHVVVGGDTCERRKPDPQPLLFACESLAVAPSHALMVGDSISDVSAARAARIPIVCVPYGYNEGQDPRSLACDAMIESLADLPDLLWPPTRNG
ncbi:MAG TPA: phosphoglycolate phosphatase [Steroidobacteraceae bacterium]|jgi:phosphoglycolate phosphatase|nr:phosphoglycolate phosphatase [Steroidobacteraceae bacterium]